MEFNKISSEEKSHRYLGRQLCISLSKHINIEFQNRTRAAWAAFHKHKCVLLDHKVSLRQRLKMFTASAGPALLFGTTVLPMTRHHLKKLDTSQRKMLRRILSWRRIDGEDWKETMKRMKLQIAHGLNLYYCRPLSISLVRNQ